MTSIVIPRDIDFLTWAANLYIDLPNLNIPLATSEKTWKEWARRLLLGNELDGVPLPDNFTDWQNWADYFVNNV
jgi:hypothetical protein